MNEEGMTQKISDEVLSDLRLEILERTAGYYNRKYQQGEFIQAVKELSGYSMTKAEVRYLLGNRLINPQKDARGYNSFSIDDLRNALLIKLLTKEHGTKLTLAAGCLYHLAQAELRENKTKGSAGGSSSFMDQIVRANLYWRSHILMVLFAWLFKGSVPPLASAFIRRQKSHSVVGKKQPQLEFTRTEFQQIDDLLQNPQDDLIVITTEDKEVLHHRIPYQDWVQYENNRYHWFYLEGTWPEDSNTYRMVICLPPDSYTYYRRPESEKEKNVIFMLLSACFLPLPKFSFQKENVSETEELYKSTRLDTLVNLIPYLSEEWEHSAIFIPDQKDPPRMVCLTKSQEFPTSILKDLQVPMGQLLIGWVYANNQHLFAKRVNDEDPRFLDKQTQEVAAVPTTDDDHPNGVLYVGSQHTVKEAFVSPEQMRYLVIIGRIIGELIELENMRMRNIKLSVKIMDEQRLECKSWKDFEKDLGLALGRITQSSPDQFTNENLHMVTVQIANYQELFRKSPEIARWVTMLTLQISQKHYRESGMDLPTVYERGPDEYLLFLEKILDSDANEVDFRNVLRERLNSIVFLFANVPLSVKCNIWSMPYRYSNLWQRIDKKGIKEILAELSEVADHNFGIIEHIQLGHQYEAEGSLEKADDNYGQAGEIDPNNVYVWRHRAKIRSRLRDYKDAVRWWLQVVTVQEHPKHYLHLAYNRACLGEIALAEEEFKRALTFDPKDAHACVRYGEFLFTCGRYEEALKYYSQAKLQDPENRILYLLRMIEVYFATMDYSEALNKCSLALSYQPNNTEILFWILKINNAIRLRTKQN